MDLMIPDKSLSIAEGAIAVMGWQSCTDKGSFTDEQFWMPLQKNTGFRSGPYRYEQTIPDKIKDILIHGTNGHAGQGLL